MKKRRPPRFTLVKPIRFAAEEWTRIEDRAKLVSLPPSVYVRHTALGYRLSGRINGKAIVQLSRIGNLNQIARVANATGQIRHVDHLRKVLEELLDAVRRLA